MSIPAFRRSNYHSILLIILLLFLAPLVPAQVSSTLAEFSDPARIYGSGIEATMERAFRKCFKTYLIGGRVMNLRIPFAENHDRDSMVEGGWEYHGKGKADPQTLWKLADKLLASDDFKKYEAALSDGREKVVIFDIARQTWTTSEDPYDITRMKVQMYRGLPHKPYILVTGHGLTEADVYNYLYCVGWLGMDCSGLVWYILSSAAKSEGVDLGRRLKQALGATRGADPSWYAGTSFYNSRSREILAVDDKSENLRPADILLFKTADGKVGHSAIIQSINFKKGVIRYLQSNTEAPLDERGVHASLIYFDPNHLEMSLKSPSLYWTQRRFALFPGEETSGFADDGQRYRAYGGSRVVRLRFFSQRR
jgi:cell wall-associated NlpC family hydrolase